VSEGNTLTISGTGALTIDETAYKYAGIGVSDQGNCGTVTITGGVINIQGGSNAYGIGTAGSSSARCGDITITGGQVTVTAGNFSGDRYYAIGGLYGYGSLTLDWTNTTDYIILNNGCYGLASFSLVDGKELYIEAENGGNNLIATWARIEKRDKGLTLKPLTDQFNRNIEVSSINDFPQKYAYTGEAFDVNYIVKDVLGTTLTKGTDYTETLSPATVQIWRRIRSLPQSTINRRERSMVK
jgi:hypothetical protein